MHLGGRGRQISEFQGIQCYTEKNCLKRKRERRLGTQSAVLLCTLPAREQRRQPSGLGFPCDQLSQPKHSFQFKFFHVSTQTSVCECARVRTCMRVRECCDHHLLKAVNRSETTLRQISTTNFGNNVWIHFVMVSAVLHVSGSAGVK